MPQTQWSSGHNNNQIGFRDKSGKKVKFLGHSNFHGSVLPTYYYIIWR